MFPTTDRLTTFNDAFQSRIRFAIKFSDLTTRAKKTIWETFLQKVPTEAKISGEEMGDLSRKDISGRNQLGGDRAAGFKTYDCLEL
jgi:hypothetical protein